MTPPTLTRRLRAACAFLAALLAACATPEARPPLVLMRPVVLLGEVHDNEGQHRLRLAAFKALLASGARPALALEQFDRERQPLIDRLRAQTPRPDAAALIAAAGPGGWDWAHYRPFLELALEHGLPIVAANVSREQARGVMREGLARYGYDAAVPDDLLAAHAGDIEASHCGMLDAATARRMALAQVARDQSMARALQEHAGRGVVLLAGNGHVRTDIGVPRWLDAPTRALSEAIGVLEDGDTLAAFDRRVFMPPQSRADPCEAMRASRHKP
ncbi:Cofac_haem_bdg domain-containing protein [Rubrivivax sp. A210]|uniref:ChaN family lipoprotein n=1 Tax=Rubrivivax sp. A210 TaxID=2772301 RepID=UPI001919A307|nr:ChaN family lipoprotein [Rubrivivax sp. A210]CAD5371918.1 Cofac_haem_bdg domain-containing protein [Rubrivivax sp. A210]